MFNDILIVSAKSYVESITFLTVLVSFNIKTHLKNMWNLPVFLWPFPFDCSHHPDPPTASPPPGLHELQQKCPAPSPFYSFDVVQPAPCPGRKTYTVQMFI